ncbi:MAG: ribonuclease P protein component [Deltaproteobacteria bacterium]|nr:ribonuclease P protein component [Deltaproteobacteria bacterium]
MAPKALQLRFRAEDRLRKTWEFRKVQGRGEKAFTAHFLILVLPRATLALEDASSSTSTTAPGKHSRLGVTVTKKVSPSAVQRNRVKRVVREVFRQNREIFPESCDVVVIARRGAPSLGYGEVLEEMRSAQRTMARGASSTAGRRGGAK